MLGSQVNSSRRQSLRLKGNNAIYMADDAGYSNFQNQTTGNNRCGPNQIFESPLLKQGDKSVNAHTENCGDKERIVDSDDTIIIDMTLKDIQKRCKAKKLKQLKPVVSSASDIKSDRSSIEPKEEEPDIEEPLINLKSKLSNKYSSKRKRRKCSHLSECFSAVEETITQACPVLKAHCSSPIKTTTVSIKKDLTAANISDNNMGAVSLKDPLHADSSKLIYDVNSKIMDIFLSGVQSMNNGAVCSTLGDNDSCNVLDNSSAEQLQIVGEGKSGRGDFFCFVSDVQKHGVIDDMDMVICDSYPCPSSVTCEKLQFDMPEPAIIVKSENFEVESPKFENTTRVSDSTTYFIAKFNHSENSSCELFEKVNGGESRFEGSPYSTSDPLPYCIDEVSSEMKGADNSTCLSECTEDHFGEIREEPSRKSFLKHSSSLSSSKNSSLHVNGFGLVSVAIDLSTGSSDGGDIIENEGTLRNETKDNNPTNGNKCSSTVENQESMSLKDVEESKISGDVSNQVDEATAMKMQSSRLQNDVLIDNSLLCREENDLKMVSYSRSEGGCLDNSIFEAICGDPLTKSNKDHNVSQADECSPVETYDVCHLHSHARFSTFYDLHGVDQSSFKNDVYSHTLEQMVNGFGEKTNFSELEDKLRILSSVEELTEALNNSPQVSSPCPSRINDLHNVEDNLCKAAELLPPSVAGEKQQLTVGMSNYPSNEMSSMYDGQSMVNDQYVAPAAVIKFVEHPPKKLLSNRKDLSPTTQEILIQALNVNCLYDTKTFDYVEAEEMSSNILVKRTKSSTNGSLPVTKGILRSPDKSGGTCSCTKSTFIHTQAQKAITFSQRQMQDIESLTTRLLRELKSMKSILEDTVSSDECPLAPPKYTCEEIRTATQSVSSLEATTRKWLSMMAKDCNRFCKIMRSTENKADVSPNSLRKQRKKITFADEAGGSLCHVKIFKQQSAALFEVPRSED